MIVRPPRVSPAHQRRLKRVFTRLLDRAHDDAQRLADGALRTIITDNGTIGTTTLPQLAGDIIGAITSNVLAKIRGIPVSGVAPLDGQVLVFHADAGPDGMWEPGAPGTPTGEIIDYSSLINEARVVRGASASASSTNTSIPFVDVEHPMDSDDSTNWATAYATSPTDPAAGAWWKVDLGSAKEITWYRVVQPTYSPYRATSSKLQSSTDDVAWTDQVTFGIFHDSGLNELPSPVTARYWRMLGVEMDPLPFSGLNAWGLASVELFSGQPTIQAPGHTIQDEGTGVTQRPALNFVGAGVAVTDDSGNDATLVTVSTADHDHTATAGDGGVLTNDEHDGYSEYLELGSPPTAPDPNKLRIYALDKAGVSTLYLRRDDGSIVELPTIGTGGTGANADAAYVLLSADLTLPNSAVLSDLIGRGLLADRPAAEIAGRLYYATDQSTLYRDNGAAWQSVEAAASTDEHAKVSSNDTTAGYLHGKLVAGGGITLTENNDGANETLTIAAVATVGRYRQFVYTVAGGDFAFLKDASGQPVMALESLE